MQTVPNEFLWSEKYRPQKVDDCVLPKRLKDVFQSFVDKKEIPSLLLAETGVGKTTVALALCEELGCSYMFINSSDERGIDTLRNKIKSYAGTASFVGGRKVVILDEADGLTADAQAALRGVMEDYSTNCTFIFTCNFKARIIEALHSRCQFVDFQIEKDERVQIGGLFFRKLCNILDNENIPYEKEYLAKIVEKYFPDFRKAINELQKLASSGKIDAGILAHLKDLRDMDVLIKALKEKNFGIMRKWVVDNSDIEPRVIFRKIYDGVNDYFTLEGSAQAILILGKYQYQAAFVADQEINAVACLTEIMADCGMK